MEVVIVASPDDVAAIAADIVCHQLATRPSSVIGLATGSSPLPTYRELIARHVAGRVSFADATAFLLDEYVGLPLGHPQTYRSVIEHDFVSHVDLAPGALRGPDGFVESMSDLATAADRYERQILDAGGIDLQILGVGGDGHIAFNEPGSSLASRTRVKTLTNETRADNARFFPGGIDVVPRHVLTQGIGTILDARHLVLVATGRSKSTPIALAVEGPVTASVPASALQLHRHVTVIVDEPAAAELVAAGYYREALANKPAWQRF